MNWGSPPGHGHPYGGVAHVDTSWGNQLKPPRWALHPKGEFFAHASEYDQYLQQWKAENNVSSLVRANVGTPPVHQVDSDIEEVDGPYSNTKKKGNSPNGTTPGKFGETSASKRGSYQTTTPPCVRCKRNYTSMRPMKSDTEDFICPWCRLMHMDPWYPTVKILARPKKVMTLSSGICEMEFTLAKSPKDEDYQVQLRCVSLDNCAFYPMFPDTCKATVNGKPAIALDPPKYLHVRREENKTITAHCHQGTNKVIINYQHPKQVAGWVFVVVQTRRVTMETIARSVAELAMDQGRKRTLEILQGHAEAEEDEELKVVIPKKEEISLRCPLTLTRIDIAAHGKHCRHLQAFDLQAFLVVNTQNKNMQTRWQCPVCQGPARPEELYLDLFFQSILVADDTKNVVKIKVEPNGSYFPLQEDESEPPESSDEEMPPAFKPKEPVVVSLDD